MVVVFFLVGANDFGLGEGGDFHHPDGYQD
jgi:hypothetical protein